ncbi:MAG: VWA domain-containing protein [Spirochaetales bacterium]|nr:VWA domain-containing protein [Spirochaetales bacterium]
MYRKLLGVLVGLILFATGINTLAGEELIQMAILLDTSGSMDGLIGQAKSQLWTIVNELARAKRNGKNPKLEVALFEYGNDGLPSSEGYMRMISDLTVDLDKISEELFALKTNGGSEYCGMVIDRAAAKLSWSEDKNVFKVIYIAGNEEFTQGNVSYKKACPAAIARGIIVNTIFCGDHAEGINTYWKDGADLADGKYMSIDQNEQIVQINTPYDSEIVELGNELNATYVAYGDTGKEKKERQSVQDANAGSMGMSSLVERNVTKAQEVYSNDGWDLVDAVENEVVDVEKLKDEELPEEMKGMNGKEKKEYVKEMSEKRASLQKRINELNIKRQEYVTAEMKKNSTEDTLDQAILSAIREQVKTRGFVIE